VTVGEPTVLVGVEVRGQRSCPGTKIKHGVGDRRFVAVGVTDAAGVEVIVGVVVGELGVTV